MEGLDFKILRHLQASQENICSRNFGTHERERKNISRCTCGSPQHTGVDGA